MVLVLDTIDLQDHVSPSAKDHSKQPTHPAALGAGPPAPHQAEALREVAAEAEEEQHRSPRVTNDWNDVDINNHAQHYGDEKSSSIGPNRLTGANLEQQDALAIAQNGGLTGAEDAEMADAEGDDGLEDDMMDKISSSPSIDDGGYSVPPAWPERLDSLSLVATPKSSCSSLEWTTCSSSPFVETPEHFPLTSPAMYPKAGFPDSEPHHLLPLKQYMSSNATGEASSTSDDEKCDILGPLPNDILDHVIESYDDDCEVCPTDELFAVQSDFDLYDSFEDGFDPEVMMIPYETSEEEDNDEVSLPEDSRFVDSGWGGECLQESEDIDFDLVYALHTFVATVEGRANAAKGDTMVLLDDSNSYWWLVRVVKDSSIGRSFAQSKDHADPPTPCRLLTCRTH